MRPKEDYVVLKPEHELLVVGQTKYRAHEFYPCFTGYPKATLVYGQAVNNANFEKYFETVQDLMLREFEILGITKNGELISKTAFKELLDVHQLGRTSKSGFKVGYIYTHPKELMYVFMPFFTGDTKTACINQAYRSVRDIIEGDMQCVIDNYVQRTNTGIPVSMNASHVFDFRDRRHEKPFVL